MFFVLLRLWHRPLWPFLVPFFLRECPALPSPSGETIAESEVVSNGGNIHIWRSQGLDGYSLPATPATRSNFPIIIDSNNFGLPAMRWTLAFFDATWTTPLINVWCQDGVHHDRCYQVRQHVYNEMVRRVLHSIFRTLITIQEYVCESFPSGSSEYFPLRSS